MNTLTIAVNANPRCVVCGRQKCNLRRAPGTENEPFLIVVGDRLLRGIAELLCRHCEAWALMTLNPDYTPPHSHRLPCRFCNLTEKGLMA